MGKIAAVGSGNFDAEVIKSKEPVVVDFWAEWCRPCLMLTPVLENISAKYEGKLKVVKCNIDENQDVAQKYGVTSIPNLIFFKGGQVEDQVVGYRNEADLSTQVDEILNS